MLNRLNLLFIAFAILLLSACAGSKGSSRSFSGDDHDGGGGPVVRANELKEARDEAVNLTEENHKMAREIFELKNRLGLPTDE
ncbi:MAG: hypothetical protein LBC85_03485 [Fibromonadaceae bacterium]|nr:hypothetical protein [Fibromonadaceae bacterium]